MDNAHKELNISFCLVETNYFDILEKYARSPYTGTINSSHPNNQNSANNEADLLLQGFPDMLNPIYVSRVRHSLVSAAHSLNDRLSLVTSVIIVKSFFRLDLLDQIYLTLHLPDEMLKIVNSSFFQLMT